MADPFDERDALLAREYGGKPSAELRNHRFPWYKRAGHALTDMFYGDNATPQDNAWVQKFTGPENPLNFPAQITHGASTAMTGYQQGDPMMMGAGAAEAALAAFIPGSIGLRMGAKPIESYLASRRAQEAAEAAKGPWGNPRMLDEMLDSSPRIPRHEANVPVEKPFKSRSSEELNSEYQALIDDALVMLHSQPGRSSGNVRFSPEPFTPPTAYQEAKNQPWGYGYKGEDPPSALARDVRRHADNNENVPAFYEEADAMAQRLAGLTAAQKPYRDTNSRATDNFYKFMNPDSGRHRYLRDVDTFYGRGKNSRHSAERDGHSIDDIESVLKNEFGANSADPKSIEQAYKAFWADEYARRTAGKMTRHEEDKLNLAWSNKDFVRRELGLDPDKAPKEQVDKASEAFFANLKGEVEKARLGYEQRNGLRGFDPENNPTMRAVADILMRYGPPTAVGGYAGHELGGMWRDSARERWENGGKDAYLRSLVNKGAPDLKYPPGLPKLPD